MNLLLLAEEILHVQIVGFKGKTLSWESGGDNLMLLFWSRCSFLPALQDFLQGGWITNAGAEVAIWGWFFCPSEPELQQFHAGASHGLEPDAASRGCRWPRTVPVPGAAVSPTVAGAGSRYDCVPPPPKAPVTGLGTSYDWPLSPPPLGSAAESPF